MVSIRVLFIITTIATAGWAATLPFLAVYLAVSRDTPFWIIGVSYLATGLLTLVSQVIGGRLVDTMGPKRVMIIGMALAVPFTLVLGYLVSVNSSVAAIAILYPISTLARGISGPAQSSLLVTYDVKKMNAAFSILTIGGNLGFAMGPLIGGILASTYNFSAVFFSGRDAGRHAADGRGVDRGVARFPSFRLSRAARGRAGGWTGRGTGT